MAISTNWNNDSSKNQYNEYKSCFETREGIYKLIIITDLFSREKEIPNVNSVNVNTSVMLSFLNRKKQTEYNDIESFDDTDTDIMCVNYGKELFVYPFDSYNINQENVSPLDKRLYKCTFPTCHDFNESASRSPAILLIVGFTGGQVQLLDPKRKDHCRLFNEERHIDKTAVTCIKWIPTTTNQFIVSHASGFIYVYKEDLPCTTLAPVYQIFKQGNKFNIYTCKTKSTRNPLYRWEFESPEKEAGLEKALISPNHSLSATATSFLNSSKYCAVNHFVFSPTGQWLAVASQDGFLRIFDYHKMELYGCMRSYFGGIMCLDWSLDEKFIVTGGQDDLVSVWSVEERVVICRGQGHKSWVSTVKFDPYMCPQKPVVTKKCKSKGKNNGSSSSSTRSKKSDQQQNPSDNDEANGDINTTRKNRNNNSCKNNSGSKKKEDNEKTINTYRFGSVGQDTQLCLWELTEDVIRQALKYAMHQREKNKHFISVNSSSTSFSSSTTDNNGNKMTADITNNSISITPTNSGSVNNHANETITGSSDNLSNHNTLSSSSGISVGKLTKLKFPKSHKATLSKNNSAQSVTTNINPPIPSSNHVVSPSSPSVSIGQKLASSFGGLWNNNASSGSSTNHSNNDNNSKRHLIIGSSNKSHSLKQNNINNIQNDRKMSQDCINDEKRLYLGTLQCPRLEDIPMLEPIVSKHVSSDRLTDMEFREESLLCTCQQGTMYAWARPGYSVIKTLINQDNDDTHRINNTHHNHHNHSSISSSSSSNYHTTNSSSSPSNTGFISGGASNSKHYHQMNNSVNYKLNRNSTNNTSLPHSNTKSITTNAKSMKDMNGDSTTI